MPRIPPSLFRTAKAIDRILPKLLPQCRDLRAAQNELRWLREHAEKVARARRAKTKGALLRDFVQQRARGRPLQYILGTEFFGDLELRCRPGVLIPRQDTAASVQHLVRLLSRFPKLPTDLRVLDLCTGSGCIPLLFHHDFYAARDDVNLRILGVDVSDEALRLATYNHKRVQRNSDWVARGEVDFLKADILLNPIADQDDATALPLVTALNLRRFPYIWDILISNPPYISPSSYWKTTTRSVRIFEPKLALVPPPSDTKSSDFENGDTFYQTLLSIAQKVDSKVVLLEIADLDQALRVARRARDMHVFDGIEIWRDQPDEPRSEPEWADGFAVCGQGNARSVVCWRGSGADWLQKEQNFGAVVYDTVANPNIKLDASWRLGPEATETTPVLESHRAVPKRKKKS